MRKVAIVGSGAAGLGALWGVLESAGPVAVTLFDTGGRPRGEPEPRRATREWARGFYDGVYRELEGRAGLRFPPPKTHLGEPLPIYRVGGGGELTRSDVRGGLTNYWGGTMLPFGDRELRGWPLGRAELEPHYAAVAERVGISGRTDGLNGYLGCEYANRPAIRLLPGLERLDRAVNAAPGDGGAMVHSGVNRVALETRAGEARACIYCGECLAGCFLGSVFSTRGAIEGLAARAGVEVVDRAVHRVDLERRRVVIGRPGDLEAVEGFDHVFLCAGCIGTTAIVMRSLGLREGPVLVDNAVAQFPVLDLGIGAERAREDAYLALSNLLLLVVPHDPAEPVAQVQLYPNFDYLWRSAVPERIWPAVRPLVRATRGRILWARTFVHSDLSSAYAVRLDGEGEPDPVRVRAPDRRAIGRTVARVRRAVRADGFLAPPVPFVVGSSAHYAATLPFGNGLVPVGPDGAIAPGVHVCDSSAFPETPAISPTFTIMANALRIAREALG